MGEGIELPERHHLREDHPLILPVSLTISIMAVFVAGVSLLGHRAHTEGLRLETQAASRWAQYQAKSVRLHEAQGFSDVVKLVAPLNKELGEELKDKYSKEVEHYEGDKVDVSKEAKNLEDERDLTVRQADRFDGGEVLLEIGLVICSITLLTKRKGFWLAGVLIGAVGVTVTATSFFLH
ncbi:MAG: hypothetical protein AUI12_14755 [Acidobacteria bacterium 13_2_20CM_2_57_6]|nr:MAG: hypothetical protein AUH16_07780 [Acidobacteria bacterium 13_2_20CM_57_7]OLB84046.1 MAG: hypothetical protein AUI12_14755 [Acidobacteria bacterium 13_2_20CM_2_57_6]PYT39128.1 MAG: DUF4337 domain-containing protein [Acidobacteriota bacterium]PYT46627.1 MAG: DUF4337 domain-containing protein [Acidobacteriota bacterium]PYT52378.1 MAG: DUF4337 domain-containing protein [Acidobacteriota bacterium]